jgi:uncharacterized membrane protein
MASFHVIAGGTDAVEPIAVRKITFDDIRTALSRGLDDFISMPSHLAFLGLIYPIFGVCLAAVTFSNNALPLLYPLATGFALVGPFAAIGLYEISRRRERGEETTWKDAFSVLRSPAIPSILTMGVLLTVIFVVWLSVARHLYESLFGVMAPVSYGAFLSQVLSTPEGWTLFILGNLIGLLFAAIVLTISVVSIPLLIDRDVGVAVAILTSAKAVFANPGMMALWGLIVAAALLVGSIPLFVGLAIVVPVLGHATWHLYRRGSLPPPTRAAG